MIWLILLGLLFRLWRFSQVPASLYWDEVAVGLDARALIQTGRDLSGGSWLQPLFFSYGDYKAPVYIWLTTILGKLAGVSELTVRLPSLLASLTTAYLVYRLVKLVSAKNSRLPQLALANFLIMPWAAHFGRVGMESHLSLTFLTLAVYLVVAAAKTRHPFKLVLSSLAVSAGIFTYISLRLVGPALFIAAFIIYHKKNLRPSLPAFTAGLGVIILSSLILLKSPDYSLSQRYRLSNDNLVTSTTHITAAARAQGENPDLLSRLVNHRYVFKVREYLTNYSTHFSPDFLFISGDANLRHHSGFGGELLLAQGVLVIFGLLALVGNLRPEAWLILVWAALSPAVASLVNEVPHAGRSIYLIVPLAWLTALGTEELIILFKKNSRRLASAAIVVVLAVNFLAYAHDYFIHYPARSQLAWLNPYKQAALYFKDRPPEQKTYVTAQWFQPGLYFAFYQDVPATKLQATDNQYLLEYDSYQFSLAGAVCPENSLCVVPADWKEDITTKASDIPGTLLLVVKTAK
ncbi:MAG: hypothetical protein UX85_C0005G0021 [Candidatus Beckwithbacteria bacterium GW2011_GWB1_47_15]|uniref:Glycosyltransferase RgtA/B/C/D-like domain-containing protein n=1 Tax=Candidatus Beckwithbacteria bacterium GW2011_GWB1_47_15 TaxID=1618371 RepID=A0A0G1U3R8_9BACT|nr:MAG: glycosyl transferase family protein [Candidatus Beckwithbacteria bacterium GW2011_GWC1_49_16]KKU35729.1 MAG: hypothetical protein UX50_C0002G0156 [Candidatus Beckwithbacteria bacterium GW2011_GWA1_46_30]KKU60983.1 MAG: hypothetical protein UX85_C0005G0021 [Candidatus Beckwithbacteria bacterium GW2011_GWB1_47_15]KKU72288.1 MAG: hypothetical protein UX97_C0001G0158 [Candidatus Beckwithbacteria bacterium GW2011_GWA2_47_25]KKW04952.1 MAG: hypothetical protein UY37_C0001G0056 [Candidatus Bec